MTGYNNATGEPRSIFTRFLPPTWRNLDSSKLVHNAIISSIQDTLVEAESSLIDTKTESFLAEASGIFLDKWGSYIGISRKPSETDEHYRTRIKQWLTKEKGTVNSLVDNIKLEFEDDNLEVYIYEPWRNIFTLNKSMLNGVDHLQGNYYRFAVIDIHIGSAIDMSRLATIVDRYKDAGVVVYFTYDTGMSILYENYDITLKSSSFLTKAPNNSLLGSLSTTFRLGQPQSTATQADLFTTNDSHTNGGDVLAGNPYRDKLTYNMAGISSEAGSLINKFTNSEFSPDFRGWDIPNGWYSVTKVEGYNGSNGIRLDASNADPTDTSYKHLSRTMGGDNAIRVPKGATTLSIKVMGYIESLANVSTSYINASVIGYAEDGTKMDYIIPAGNLLNIAVKGSWQPSNTRLLNVSIPEGTAFLNIDMYLRGQGVVILSQPMLVFDTIPTTYLPGTLPEVANSVKVNLINNSEFSPDLSGWYSGHPTTTVGSPFVLGSPLSTDSKQVVDTTQIYNGSSVLKRTTGSPWAYTDLIPVVPGQSLSASIQTYASEDYDGNVQAAYYFRWYDSNKNYLSVTTTNGNRYTAWSRYYASVTVPANAAYVSYELGSNGTIGTVYYAQPMLNVGSVISRYVPSNTLLPAENQITDTSTLLDFSETISEYNDEAYIASNNKDGIVYQLPSNTLVLTTASLLTAIDNVLKFTINAAKTSMSYTYDTSKVDSNLKYYVDLVLANADFSLVNKKIVRTSTRIMISDTEATDIMNATMGLLDYYIDSSGKAQLVNQTSTVLYNKMVDFSKLYTFSIDANGSLVYSHTAYTPIALSTSEVAELYRVTSFTLSSGTILAYTTTSSTMADIDKIVHSVTFSLNDTNITATVPNLPTFTSITNVSARDSLYVFNWDEYVKQNVATLDIDNTIRYIKITTRGSEYGFNSNKITIINSAGADVSSSAKWIKGGTTTLNLPNGSPISFPTSATSYYILDLGSTMDIASITLGDTYASPVRRTVDVSKDNVTYDKVSSVYSTGGDTIIVSDYINASDKGAWIHSRTAYNVLNMLTTARKSNLEISLYNFNTLSWDIATSYSKDILDILLNIDSINNISKKGLTIIRVASTQTGYGLDYLGVNSGWY